MLIEQMHTKATHKCALVVTGVLMRNMTDSGPPSAVGSVGCGSGAISSLLAVPGASKTLVEATVPYAMAALDDYLGSASCDAPGSPVKISR